MLSFSYYQLCIEQHLTWFHWYSVGCLIFSFKLRLIKMFLNANLSNNDSYEHNQSVKLTIKLVRVWEVFCWIKSDGTFTSTLALRQPSHKLILAMTLLIKLSIDAFCDFLILNSDQEADIQSFVCQLSTCFKLLIPSQDVFDVFDDKLFTDRSQSSPTTGNQHSHSYSLAGVINNDKMVSIIALVVMER